MKVLLSIAALATLALWIAAGCSSQSTPTDDGTATTSTSPSSTTTDAPSTADPSGGSMQLADYTNDKGEIVCPVMGTIIKDKSKAVGTYDYEGKRYYFCCGGCPELFEADPAKYSDGKALEPETKTDEHDH
ncbi:MAG: YHS domain-containing protein [Fimbriimonadaceae bacterium]|nr:MAG: YHS domain protein [Armatimonadetes bacterium OLB18]WKZ80828.1 MAG: YHS domain-containing protein [Fimbriimonadaceae bacterium]